MPEFPPCCIENVHNIGGTLCDWNTVCKPVQDHLDKYCKDSGQNPCAAVPQVPDGKVCYCCCSCFAYNTPIEAAPGQFVLVQDIVANVDHILAGAYQKGSLAPIWEERVVNYSSGFSASPGEPELEFDYMYYVTYQVEDGSQPPQYMIVTVDHLFLRPDGKVTPVQFLAPDDRLVNAHGGFSIVSFVIPARYKGGLHHVSFDGFDNKTLKYHLISANGVVTADYSVQLAYSSGDLNPDLIDQPPKAVALRASETAYQARYANSKALAFVADKTLWPKGMTPTATDVMINVPIYAARFLTDAQAADVQAHAPMLPIDSTTNVTAVQWLFEVYGAFFSNPIYLVDWQNETPNAYTWEINRQRFILFTGGLLRIQRFNQEGLAFVLSHLVAVAGGLKCVGPADYDGVFAKMRQVWRNALYFSIYSQGLEQIRKLFGYVTPEHAEADPADICAQPSLQCRLSAMEAAASMRSLPACADPHNYFGVVSAKVGRNPRHVVVVFNEDVNPESGGTLTNYKITDAAGSAVPVLAAEVCRPARNEVRLRVAKFQHQATYTVTVTNVVSDTDKLIDPAHASAEFRTGKLLG